MIFIGYKNNGYYFMHYTQWNVIFHFTHAIFNKELFSKCTDFCIKEHKLYNNLLDKISLEIESSVPEPSSRDRPALVSIPPTSIPPIQNNSPS